MRTYSSFAAFFAAALFAVPAQAQRIYPVGIYNPREPSVSALERIGQLGLEVSLAGAGMYAGGNSPVQAPNLYPANVDNSTGVLLNPASCGTPASQCTFYGADPFGIIAAVGWRFRPEWSVGLNFRYASYNAVNGADTGDYPDGTSGLTRSQWTLGLYGRYYLTMLHPRIQPWVSVGVGFSYDSASYQRGVGLASLGQPERGDYLINHKGVDVPVTVGVDFRLAPVFSVGPMIGYERVFPVSGCVEVDVGPESPVPPKNTCNSPPVQVNGYGVVFGGVYAKITLGKERKVPRREPPPPPPADAPAPASTTTVQPSTTLVPAAPPPASNPGAPPSMPPPPASNPGAPPSMPPPPASNPGAPPSMPPPPASNPGAPPSMP